MSTNSSKTAAYRRALLALCWLLIAAPAMAERVPRVLVLYSNNRLLPANIKAEGGLRETLGDAAEISGEFLDYPRFSGAAYVRTLTTFLHEKYGTAPPDLIVAGGEDALDFLLRYRADLFPLAPVVHMGVLRSALRLLPTLPEDVVGSPIELDFAGTINLALRLHPGATRLVLVTGTALPDRSFEARLREEVPRFQDRAQPEFLAGLPTAALVRRLGELGPDAVVFTPGYFQDGAGRHFVPREAASRLAEASGAPLYGPFDTFIGTGVVGGYMQDFAAMGRQAGQTVQALLAGTAPTLLHLPEVMPTTLNLDWRQVLRWDIDTAAIPADAVILFKAPSFLDEHRREVIAATALFLLQSGLLAWLLIEHRRRRQAELALQQQRFALAHASRLAIAGELTGAIAHEINQPLGAILSNTDAADILLDACRDPGPDKRPELREILADIRRDNLRASEVIRRLRTLLDRNEVERQPFDLNEVIRDTLALLGTEARRRRVTIAAQTAPEAPNLVGDRFQIQQVLINLLINAMEVMTDLPEERREILVAVVACPDGHTLMVRDAGPGIAPEHLSKLFESFFTTKPTGMGLGLSIARTLIEAHGGRIWAENAAERGAIFHCWFPVAATVGNQSAGPS